MSKRNKNHPKMLPTVLQAIADLRELRGSTTKNICDRVQTTLNRSKTYPKPRNVVMQVKRAIKHAVDAGIVTHKSGRYKLAKIVPSSSSKTLTRKISPKAIKKAPVEKPKKYKKVQEKEKEKPRRRKRRYSSYSSAGTETTMSSRTRSYTTFSDATSVSSYYEEEKKKPVMKPKKAPKKPKQKKKPKPPPPEREEPRSYENQNECEQDMGMPVNQAGSPKRSNQRMAPQQQPDYDNMGQYILEDQIGNVCDNPDCLCNMKQEPLDDLQVQYDDDIHCTDYLN